MSSYSELIKNFEKIRAYMREFYVYGFKSRDDYSSKSSKSARSYIDKAERSDPSIQLPSGLFSSRKTKTHREESSVIAPCIIHQKPSEDFRDWISDEWYDIEEMLPLKDVPKLIGYNEKTIQRWAHQKTLKTVWHQNHLFTTRDWVIDFLVTEGYKVQNKSLLHTRLLLQYYNQ